MNYFDLVMVLGTYLSVGLVWVGLKNSLLTVKLLGEALIWPYYLYKAIF